MITTKNILIVLVVVVALYLYTKKSAVEVVVESVEGVENETIKIDYSKFKAYSNVIADWATFAQAIKSNLTRGGSVEEYEAIVNKVRGFLKGHNIEAKGWNVKLLTPAIVAYLANDGRVDNEILLSELRN